MNYIKLSPVGYPVNSVNSPNKTFHFRRMLTCKPEFAAEASYNYYQDTFVVTQFYAYDNYRLGVF